MCSSEILEHFSKEYSEFDFEGILLEILSSEKEKECNMVGPQEPLKV